MSNYWVNFAKTGDPNGEGLPLWAQYDTKKEAYLEFNDGAKAGHALLKPQCDLLEKYYAAKRAEK